MNNIFLKNLTALNKKNPDLAKKLESYIPNELPKLVQENGTYNILYKGTLIHNSINPLIEAQEIFNTAENTPVSIHVIFGIGLGYLFQIASLKSNGTVIILEPDLNILWFSFTLVDFSNDIMKPNVFFASDFETVADAIYKKSNTKNTPQLISLPSQRKLTPTDFETLVTQLQQTVGTYTLNLKYTKEKFYPSLKMLIQNFSNLINETPLAYYKDIYKGKTAVIVSAGPTLDRNIDTLKKYRDRYILFTVGTAVKTLYKHNIKPDFLCIIETYDSRKQVEGLDLSDVNFITEPYSHPALREIKFKNIFSHISANTPTNHLWAEIFEEKIEEYSSKGTVSYTALNSARILGCSKLVLVGQDLAYIEGQCYSKDSAYKDLHCQYNTETNNWEIVAKDFEQFANAISAATDPIKRERAAKRRLENLNKSLYYVKGIKGDMIPTEAVYSAFVKPLEEFVITYNDREYINTSLVGAQLNGFKNLSLEDALNNSIPIEDTTLCKNEKHTFSIDSITKNIQIKLNELISVKPKLEEGIRLVKNLNNDIKRYRSANSEVLKSLKKLSVNYISLSTDFASKSKMFDFIITADRIDIDYEMKMLKDFSTENIITITEKMTKFYVNTQTRIQEIERLIDESINTTC